MFRIPQLPLYNGLLNMNVSCYGGSFNWKEKRLFRKIMVGLEMVKILNNAVSLSSVLQSWGYIIVKEKFKRSCSTDHQTGSENIHLP